MLLRFVFPRAVLFLVVCSFSFVDGLKRGAVSANWLQVLAAAGVERIVCRSGRCCGVQRRRRRQEPTHAAYSTRPGIRELEAETR